MRGVTLIELLICVAILGIICLIGLPKQNIAEKHQLNFATDELVMNLRWMQQMSLNSLRGNTSQPQIMPDLVLTLNLLQGNNSGYMICCGTRILKRVYFPGGIKIVSNNQQNFISFNYKGQINQPCTISLQDKDGKNRLIIIDRVGRIRTQ